MNGPHYCAEPVNISRFRNQNSLFQAQTAVQNQVPWAFSANAGTAAHFGAPPSPARLVSKGPE